MDDPSAYTTIRLQASERRRLEELAAANERSMSAEIRMAIRAYLALHTPVSAAVEDAAA